jgi:hypothetical protein
MEVHKSQAPHPVCRFVYYMTESTPERRETVKMEPLSDASLRELLSKRDEVRSSILS